jgi:hypothetical protein
MFSVCCSLNWPLFIRGFQRLTFPFLWLQLPGSDKSNSKQLTRSLNSITSTHSLKSGLVIFMKSGTNRAQNTIPLFLCHCCLRVCLRSFGSKVVRTVCSKPEGRGFETRWVEWMFSIYQILPTALGPGFHSASNRIEYQKQKNNVSGE